MADGSDKGRSYLKRLAKNRLRSGGTHSVPMGKRTFKKPPMKNANLNTKPDTPPPAAINRGNRNTHWYTSTGPGNLVHPTRMHRSTEAPNNRVSMRKVT